MKKKLALLMTMMLMASSMVGCTSEQKSYFEETQKVSKWESTESGVTGNMLIKVAVPDVTQTGTAAVKTETEYETINVDFDANGYTLNEAGKELKGMVTMNLKSDNDMINIKDVKIFVDGDKVYISKNYFEGIMASAGESISEKSKQIKQEYILIDSSVENAMMTDSDMTVESEAKAMNDYIKKFTAPETRDEMLLKFAKVMEIIDFDLPVTKSGRTYTMQLSSDQFLEKTLKSMGNIIINTEEILKTMELDTQLNITKEDIASLQNEYDAKGKLEVITAFANARETIKGSSLTTKEVFGDNSYSSDIKLILSLKDIMNTEMTVKQTAKKVAKQTVDVPAMENAIDMNAYMEALMPETTAVPAPTTTPVTNSPVFIASMPVK